jgi:hypothetical protein
MAVMYGDVDGFGCRYGDRMFTTPLLLLLIRWNCQGSSSPAALLVRCKQGGGRGRPCIIAAYRRGLLRIRYQHVCRYEAGVIRCINTIYRL